MIKNIKNLSFACLSLFIFFTPVFVSANGSLVDTFGTGGVSHLDGSSKIDSARISAVDGTGFYVAGFESLASGTGSQGRIQKRDLSSGALIWEKTIPAPFSGGDSRISSLVVYGSALYVAGHTTISSGNTQIRIEKRDTTNGNLVTSFGASGVLSFDLGPGYDGVSELIADSSGIYLLETQQTQVSGSGAYDWVVEKRNHSGAALWKKSLSSSGSSAPFAVHPDAGVVYGGFLYVAGSYPTSGKNIRIEKRNLSTGDLDTTFGDGLGWISPANTELTTVNDMSADASGFYLAAGGPGFSWRVQKRDLSTGALSWSQTTPAAYANPNTSLVLSGGSLYVTGFLWRVEKRSTDTGDLEWSRVDGSFFGPDYAQDVVFWEDNLYLVGNETITNSPVVDTQWRIEKRTTLDPNLLAGNVVLAQPLVVGQEVHLSAQITNITGGSVSGEVPNIFQFDDDADHNTALDPEAGTSVYNLGVGESKTTTYSWTPPAFGVYYVRACADNTPSWTSAISESNDDDNCSEEWQQINYTLPDLSISSVFAVGFGSPIAGVATTLIATVGNTSLSGVPDPINAIFEFADDKNGTNAQTPIAGSSIPEGLASGVSGATTHSWIPPTAGSYFVRACADMPPLWVGSINESNEDNNCSPEWSEIVAAAPTTTACHYCPEGQAYDLVNGVCVEIKCPSATTRSGSFCIPK